MKKQLLIIALLSFVSFVNAQTPTVTITASVNPICAGQSTTLTPSGATTYFWNTGSTSVPLIVTPAATTTYTVTGTTAGSTGTASITITVNPNPTVSVSAWTNPVCIGDSVMLTAAGACFYYWNNGLDSAIPVIAFPTTTTNYIVTGTDVNGCTGTASITVIVDSCSGGISEINSDNNIAIFPNPASNTITITSDFRFENLDLKIYDVFDNLVLDKALLNNKTTIDISMLAKGMYFIKIRTEKRVAVRKFIKE